MRLNVYVNYRYLERIVRTCKKSSLLQHLLASPLKERDNYISPSHLDIDPTPRFHWPIRDLRVYQVGKKNVLALSRR